MLILTGVFRSFDFCLPTRLTIVPHGPDWLHEVKYDGYRLRVVRDGERVRLGVDGISDFDALHSGKRSDEVQLCAPSIFSLKAATICAFA